MTAEEKAALYAQYMPMVCKFGRKYAQIFNIPREEMLDMARSLLAEVVCRQDDAGGCWKYDAVKTGCNMTSWMYRKLNWELLTLCKNYRKNPTVPISTLTKDESHPVQFAGPENWIRQLLVTLGEDARIIVSTILEAPGELYQDLSDNAPKRSRQAVRKYFIRQGWEESRIEHAWEEVAACL